MHGSVSARCVHYEALDAPLIHYTYNILIIASVLLFKDTFEELR